MLEARIAELHDQASYTFTSCWNANEAIFPTLCEPGDLLLSDELNHASIIDGVRLAAVIKKGLRKGSTRTTTWPRCGKLGRPGRPEVTGQIWVATDGVFSMEGDIADLPGLRAVCDDFAAKLVVDDSHGTGVMGPTGRGRALGDGRPRDRPHQHPGQGPRWGAGGYMAGSVMIDLMIQRRPTLFSNALPATVACSADRAIELLMDEPQRVARLRANVEAAREGIRGVGFEVLESPTAICRSSSTTPPGRSR